MTTAEEDAGITTIKYPFNSDIELAQIFVLEIL